MTNEEIRKLLVHERNAASRAMQNSYRDTGGTKHAVASGQLRLMTKLIEDFERCMAPSTAQDTRSDLTFSAYVSLKNALIRAQATGERQIIAIEAEARKIVLGYAMPNGHIELTPLGANIDMKG